MVMRQKGSQRVILNANLWQGMIIKMMDGDKVGPEAAEPHTPMWCRSLQCRLHIQGPVCSAGDCSIQHAAACLLQPCRRRRMPGLCHLVQAGTTCTCIQRATCAAAAYSATL